MSAYEVRASTTSTSSVTAGSTGDPCAARWASARSASTRGTADEPGRRSSGARGEAHRHEEVYVVVSGQARFTLEVRTRSRRSRDTRVPARSGDEARGGRASSRDDDRSPSAGSRARRTALSLGGTWAPPSSPRPRRLRPGSSDRPRAGSRKPATPSSTITSRTTLRRGNRDAALEHLRTSVAEARIARGPRGRGLRLAPRRPRLPRDHAGVRTPAASARSAGTGSACGGRRAAPRRSSDFRLRATSGVARRRAAAGRARARTPCAPGRRRTGRRPLHVRAGDHLAPGRLRRRDVDDDRRPIGAGIPIASGFVPQAGHLRQVG